MATQVQKRCEHKDTAEEARCIHPWWMDFGWTNPRTARKERHRYSIDVLQHGEHIAGKKQAQAVCDATVTAIRAGTFQTCGAVDTKAMAFGTVVEMYKTAYIVGKNIKGRATQFSMLDRGARHFGHQVFREVNTMAWESYFAGLQQPEVFRADQKKARTRTRATCNRHITRWRHMMGWAVERGLLERSPFVGKNGKVLIKLLKGEAVRNRRVPLAEEHAIRLAGRDDTDFQDWLTVALDSGLRAGEMFGLQIGDVSLTERTITVQAHKAKSSKKRSVPIVSDRLYDVLVRRMSRTDGTAREAEALVFVDFNGAQVAISAFRDRLYRACKRSGVARMRVHDLRHEAASRWYYECGVKLQTVQLWLGHATLDMTSRYLNVREEGIQAEAAKVAAYLAKKDTLTTRVVLAERKRELAKAS